MHLPYSPQAPLWKNVPVRHTATSDYYQDHITELLGDGFSHRLAVFSVPVLIWTMMQPMELVTEHQLSHWDPVCHRPHLTHGTLPKAVLLELSLDGRIWSQRATPSKSAVRDQTLASNSN